MIMNKKVSTIFAMAALMGGSLFSSAYAEVINNGTDKDLTNGKVSSSTELVGPSLFLQIGTEYIGAEWKDSNDETKGIQYLSKTATDDLKKDEISKYLWKVSTQVLPGGENGYYFTNAATGEIMSFKKNGTGYTLADPDTKNPEIWFHIDEAGTEWTNPGATNPTFTSLSLVADGTGDNLSFDGTNPVIGATTEEINLYKLAPGIGVEVDALNKLYNTAGFNFALNGTNLSGVENIFGDKRVVAIKLNSPVRKSNTVTSTDYDYGFPAGTYFITAGSFEDRDNPKYEELVNCTFIVVDSDNNIGDDADAQKRGEGFTLTEASGKDLVLYIGKENKLKATGNQIAVQNAVFTVLESTTTEGLYDLSVTARYVEASSAATQKEATLSISAAKGDAALHTVAKGDHYIFKFSESSAVKPSALLFKGDTAAIYNIQLYVANGSDDSRNGKYLTTTPSKEFVAKGAVLADTETPAYQWVISAVDGSNITFTNRETGTTLTTQLFDEGNGIYSMQEYVPTGSSASTYTYYNVNEKGDVVAYDSNNDGTPNTYGFNYNTKIQLVPVTAATYAGYLNVDDKTIMTLSFGRDIAPTSNKLYPVYDKENSPSYIADELTGDVADAAQWQLVKSKGSNANHPVRYNYVYANGNLINTKNNGDVVYAYTYKLQLVNEGKVVENKFLNVNTSSASIGSTGSDFYIQENVDGSVLLKRARNASEAVLLNLYNDYTNGTQTIDQLDDNKFALNSISSKESFADDVKTYLIAEAPAISLPAVEGHYSFVSEQGNYITMNEERDGLTVKEDSEAIYLYVTDEEEVVPSFYITKGVSPVEGQRMYLFNPTDSVNYYVASGDYKKNYEWVKGEVTKAIFKSAAISESRDTLTTEIKGESTLVAQEASNAEKVEGGLDMFKMQIIEDPEADGLYVVSNVADKSQYLYSWNGMLGWSGKADAMKFEITGAEAPTANESVSATEVKVVAYDGAINIKNAAGKNVVISTILGQIVANEILTSDNATISVPAGIAIVSVDGEEAVKVSVK